MTLMYAGVNVTYVVELLLFLSLSLSLSLCLYLSVYIYIYRYYKMLLINSIKLATN